MEKFELDKTLAEEIRARVLGDGFMKLVQSVRRNGKAFRISLRPVLIGGETRYQAEMNDEGHVRVKNFDANGAAEGLEEIIAQKGARDLHLMTAAGDLHVRVTRKGHVLVSRSAEMDRAVKVQPHDRVKKLPLTSFDASALLRVIGLADGEGRVRASMRGKYDQVNEFLKVVEDVLKERADRKLHVVDCGCGKAYLTLALYFYLVQALGYSDVRVVGVDRRADVVAAATEMARQLDVSDRVRGARARRGVGLPLHRERAVLPARAAEGDRPAVGRRLRGRAAPRHPARAAVRHPHGRVPRDDPARARLPHAGGGVRLARRDGAQRPPARGGGCARRTVRRRERLLEPAGLLARHAVAGDAPRIPP